MLQSEHFSEERFSGIGPENLQAGVLHIFRGISVFLRVDKVIRLEEDLMVEAEHRVVSMVVTHKKRCAGNHFPQDFRNGYNAAFLRCGLNYSSFCPSSGSKRIRSDPVRGTI